ncbi:MAG: excinuclease ABC subunit UvrA [Thermodesulfovibrionales bacterium]|nr:excinuclease ABC subunit UvrA [Thermodesulfovibrionales bacterium]
MQEFIIVKGASEHNLKGIDVTIPRGKITVITGPSGSGKSSLAMDTIYAEAQRRYMESLSSYARQFIEQLKKPEVQSITGLSPSIAIDQKTVTRSPRSTVGTITEIYDYMRVIYTRAGKPFCYKCGSPLGGQRLDGIIDAVKSLPQGTRLQILSQIVRERKGEYKKELDSMRREGFLRARIDGKMVDLVEGLKLKKTQRHTIEIVIDRFIVKPGIDKKIATSIEVALRYSDIIIVNLVDEGRDILFSKSLACPKCGISYPEIAPRLFSFNSPYGACPRCNGIGFEDIKEFFEREEITEEDIIAEPLIDVESLRFEKCTECKGTRLRKEALGIRFNGVNIAEFSSLTVKEAINFLKNLELSKRETFIISRPLKEVKDRLGFLEKVGLDYLTLDRPSLTLSGGEAQRIRLATQIGSRLTGVLYVLDEPSIGLHPRDCKKLLDTIAFIRDAGNTIIIVEHDEETIRNADYIIDMGPGGGVYGGTVVASGTLREIMQAPQSLTGRYLNGELSIPVPFSRRKPVDFIEITGASEFNLKNIDVKIPLGVFICVTGVSGSGKSTLFIDILYRALIAHLYKSKVRPGKFKKIKGIEKIKKALCVDQRPLGRTPRSNPATYTGIFTLIRDLFAQIPEARMRGYNASRFSFNLPGGRCEACGGDGLKKIEMHFLPDVYVPCDECKGRRYNKETLEIKYKDKNIADILDMTVTEALEFFKNIPHVSSRLRILEEVGLGYIKLGQPVTSLSGGEAQRIRLAKEFVKKVKGGAIYILDEPTTGLHFADIEKLLNVINRLVDSGNTVIVIEHNLDVIKSSDYIIDMGPESGDSGGEVVAEGTPEEVARNPRSWTGRFLSEKLGMSASLTAQKG